jgi:hypothetical protein
MHPRFVCIDLCSATTADDCSNACHEELETDEFLDISLSLSKESPQNLDSGRRLCELRVKNMVLVLFRLMATLHFLIHCCESDVCRWSLSMADRGQWSLTRSAAPSANELILGSDLSGVSFIKKSRGKNRPWWTPDEVWCMVEFAEILDT